MPYLFHRIDGLGRESRLNFWPAYVDLMVILAVVGLLAAAEYAPSGGRGEEVKLRMKYVQPRLMADAAVDNLRSELKREGIQVKEHADGGIRIPESLLKFDSGSVIPKVDDEKKEIVRKICEAIKKSIDKIDNGNEILVIQIEGHTDSQPIGPELMRYYPTNWELSAARATGILRLMSEDYGLDPAHYSIRALGLSDTVPIEKNFESELNRRIEIKIMPDYERIERMITKEGLHGVGRRPAADNS